jgi:hypothetical protein
MPVIQLELDDATSLMCVTSQYHLPLVWLVVERMPRHWSAELCAEAT